MTQRVRGATGALVLSTALLMGGAGGAIATADTGTADSVSRDSRASDAAGRAPAANSWRGTVASNRESAGTTLRDFVRSATSALESRRDRAFTPSRKVDLTQSPDADVHTEFATDTVYTDVSASATEGVVAVDPEPAADQPIGATPTDPAVSKTAAPTPVVTAPDPSGADTPYGPASQDQPFGEEEPGVVLGPAPTIRVVGTASTVVLSLGNAAAAIPPVILALPFSQTPVSDVIALLETVLTSVRDSAAAAMQVPRDLVALLGIDVTGTNLGLIGAPSDIRIEPVTVGITPGPGPGPQTALPSLPMTPGHSVGDINDRSGFGAFTPTVLLAYTAPSQTVPASLSARVGEQQSFLDRAFGALLLPLSLWALATGALPGLAGLLVVFGAGIRVGYRQAKAGFAVRVAGIARFAGPGPLGVVRSGTLVALHQRAVRSDRPRALRWARLGDQAA